MSHEHFNSRKFVENALEMFDSYGWALDNCKMYEKYFYLSDKSRRAKGYRRWDEQRYKRSGGLAVFDTFNSSNAKSHCMNNADREKDQDEGASGHRPPIDYDTGIKEDFVNFMEMRTEKWNKKKLGVSRSGGRTTTARKDSTRLSTMPLEDSGEEKRYKFKVSIKKKRSANRKKLSKIHTNKSEQYCTRDAIARPIKKFELTPMTFVRAKDKASLPHQDCVLIEEERMEMESAKIEQQRIEGVEGNFPILQVENQLQLVSESEVIKYELPEYDLEQVIKSRSKFKFKVKRKDSFPSTRETTRGLATGAGGSRNVFTYVHTLKKKDGFTVDGEYLSSSTYASGVDNNQGKIRDVPDTLDSMSVQWAASDSNRRSIGCCTRANKTNDFSGRIPLTSAGSSENPVDSLGSALSSMSLERDGVLSPSSYECNKYCNSRAGRNRPKQGTPPEESPFLDVGILRKKPDDAYSLWIATLPKPDQTSDPIPDQSLGLGSALESVSTALFMAEPTPESVTVEPTPRSVITELTPRPVVAEPTSRPVVAEPAPRPVAVEPTRRPVVTEPTPRPVAGESTSRPAVVEPTPRPAVVEPTPRPVAAEPTPRPVVAEPTRRPVVAEPTPRSAMAEPTRRPVVTELKPRPVVRGESTFKSAMAEPMPRPAVAEPTLESAKTEPTPRIPGSELMPTLAYDLPLPTFSASMSYGSMDTLESESAVGYCPLSDMFKAPVVSHDEPLVSENDSIENGLVESSGDQQTDDESESADKYLSYEELKYLNDVIRRFITSSPANVCMVIENFNEHQAAQFRQLTELYCLKWRAVCRKNRLENSIHVTSRTKIPGAMAVDRYIRQIAGGASASANELRRSNRHRRGGAVFYNSETNVVEPSEVGEAASELSDEKPVVFGGGEPDFVQRPAFRKNASSGFLSYAERRRNQKKKMTLERLERMEKKIPATNIGYIMMSKMGWNGGGLGKEGQGLVDPIKPTYKQDRIGLREVESAKLAASLDAQQKMLDIVP